MSFTFDINKDPHFQMAKEAGIKEGIEIGMQKGIQKGHNSGLHEGIEKGIQKGIQKGRTEGLYEGISKGKSETAMRMLGEGFEMPVISRITGLSMDEIEALKHSMH